VRHRTDSLQAAVARELERAGWSVQSLSQVGNGVPDLLVASLVPPSGGSLEIGNVYCAPLYYL